MEAKWITIQVWIYIEEGDEFKCGTPIAEPIVMRGTTRHNHIRATPPVRDRTPVAVYSVGSRICHTYGLIWAVAQQTNRAVNARAMAPYRWTQEYIQKWGMTVSITMKMVILLTKGLNSLVKIFRIWNQTNIQIILNAIKNSLWILNRLKKPLALDNPGAQCDAIKPR